MTSPSKFTLNIEVGLMLITTLTVGLLLYWTGWLPRPGPCFRACPSRKPEKNGSRPGFSGVGSAVCVVQQGTAVRPPLELTNSGRACLFLMPRAGQLSVCLPAAAALSRVWYADYMYVLMATRPGTPNVVRSRRTCKESSFYFGANLIRWFQIKKVIEAVSPNSKISIWPFDKKSNRDGSSIV